ncbi:MAG: hypothetical protein PHC75_09585 [Burkholderiales bacterium]|nr:hypothetical protein [Burkholderiales bacterium]
MEFLYDSLIYGVIYMIKKIPFALTATLVIFSNAYADAIDNVTADSLNNNDMRSNNLDSQPNINYNEMIIFPGAFIQNPYLSAQSGGGFNYNYIASESHDFIERLFNDGTYNIYSGAQASRGTSISANGVKNDSYAYGATAFAQTGRVAGFSVGGAATVMNPLFANNLNGVNTNSGLLTPTNQQIALTQMFGEYQYENIVSVDVGYIAINDNPWLSGSYFNTNISVPMTYQGLLSNVYAGNGWLVTALAFNAMQSSGQNKFTGETLLNTQYGDNYLSSNTNSNGTVALGADYYAWDNNYNLRLWAYQFDKYGTLLYGDTSVNVPLSKSIALNFAGQLGVDNNFGASTAYENNPFVSSSNINSKFVGLQASLTIDWIDFVLAGNSIWGNSNSVGGGAIISPYTSNLGSDPLYAEGWITNMVNQGLTGNSYKASVDLNLLGGDLQISPGYITLSNTNMSFMNGTQEAFITATYNIPQVKGLTLFASFANQWVPGSASTYGMSNNWSSELITSYLW